ncbi:ester cyclase [Rhizobiales bacterium RZME27]|jgi:predicted ester cyclase|uniref:Ester cyclase n=1 Tax=Endobacterium cereale TaxID=2663029 RepID=A0A6A8ACF6_9HYPH|nr:ester cyclase [Endobacterium cereale]MEB2845529.1 ester cyclase [Endobacterium cereale]MQY48842.1 ester cyclase [Endobacterium cereale]
MTPPELAEIYRGYIDCLNRQDWDNLGLFVGENAHHNGRLLGLSGYRDMLINDFEQIPDLRFNIDLLVCEPPHVASRLAFDCSPKGRFLGLDVNGRRIRFAENVFYRFKNGRIVDVRSVLDKVAIEAQLG